MRTTSHYVANATNPFSWFAKLADFLVGYLQAGTRHFLRRN